MKRFRFQLESLLKYRRHLEQMARQDMARAIQAVNDCEQRIQDLIRDRGEAVERLDTMVTRGVDASVFRMYHGFLASMESMIVTERQQKKALEKQVEEKRSVLKQRTVDKKAMERLREKRQKEHYQNMLAEEQKGLDEIAALKTAREIVNGQK